MRSLLDCLAVGFFLIAFFILAMFTFPFWINSYDDEGFVEER